MVARKAFRKPQHNIPKPMNQQLLFNVSQIPDPVGFLDFNNPTPPATAPKKLNGGQNLQQQQLNKKVPKKQKGNLRPQQQQQQHQQQQGNRPPYQRQPGNNNWNRNRPNMDVGNRRFPQNGMPPRGYNVPSPRPMGMRPMLNNMGGRRMPPNVMPPNVIPPFRQPPMIPPMAPMVPPMPRMMAPLPPPAPYRRPPPVPLLPPMRPMQGMQRNKMGARMPGRGGNMHPGFNNSLKAKAKKLNTGAQVLKKPPAKGRSTIKTLKNLVNQYPLDKPWVTDDIRAEYDKKVDIENRLKGNKDDDLFAQFKAQRDKFVGIYESAREEYLKEEAAAVKAKKKT